MSFAQFHDGFYRNPKVRAVEPAAAWMWTASIGYANENLTDGFIPKAALHDLAVIDAKPRVKLVEQLVAERLWEPCEGGWMIHDFLMWNPSKAAVLARRAANLARVNKHRDNAATHGDGNARVMRYNERTQRVSNPPPNASVPNASSEDNSPSGSAEGATAPNPPPPVVTPSGERLTTDAKEPEKSTATKGDDAKPAKPTKRKRAKAAPTPDTIPAPNTLARRVFEAIVGDRALCAIVGNPGDAAERWADPATYPGVDVLAEVRRAGEFAASHPGRYGDGRAFLRGWLQRKADEIARAPKTAQHDPSVNGQTYVAPPPPQRAFVPKVVPLPPGFDAALLGGVK